MESKLSIEKFELIPGRIDAAMQYVRHCQSLMVPESCFGSSTQGRELSPTERAVYLAALDALRLYFTAEMDYGGPPTCVPEPSERGVNEAGQKKRKKRDKE